MLHIITWHVTLFHSSHLKKHLLHRQESIGILWYQVPRRRGFSGDTPEVRGSTATKYITIGIHVTHVALMTCDFRWRFMRCDQPLGGSAVLMVADHPF